MQGRAFCCKNQRDRKEKRLWKAQSGPWIGPWAPLMSSTPINYSLRGLAPLYILPQSFLNCFILKKTLENTKSLKNPHPDSNIVQEVRHSCAMNHMQAIRMLFQCSAKDLLNQFVQFKKKRRNSTGRKMALRKYLVCTQPGIQFPGLRISNKIVRIHGKCSALKGLIWLFFQKSKSGHCNLPSKWSSAPCTRSDCMKKTEEKCLKSSLKTLFRIEGYVLLNILFF